MSLFKTLGQKPWLHGDTAVAAPVPEFDAASASRTALKFILAIVGVLFFLFIITFLSRSQ